MSPGLFHPPLSLSLCLCFSARKEMGEFGERGSDVPWWVKHPLFKGLVVAGLIMGALSPVFLKVMLLVWGGGSFYVRVIFFVVCCFA